MAKKFKWLVKILCFIFFCLCGLGTNTIFAADSLVIKAGEVSAFTGVNVKVPIVLSSEGGIAGVQFDVSFDTKNITFEGIEDGDLDNSFFVMSNPLKENLQRILIYSLAGSSMNGGSQTICNLSFRVSQNAEPDSVTNINLSELSISNAAGQDISDTALLIGGKITVLKVPDAPIVPVSGVFLDQTEVTLTAQSDSYRLVAVINPLNATNKKVEWTSSNPKVAAVKEGLITPLEPGKTQIQVTTADGLKKAGCMVTVVAGPSIKLMVQDGRGISGANNIKIPIVIASNGGIGAVQLDLGYNPSLLGIKEIQKSESLSDFSLATNSIDGDQRILLYSVSGAEIPSGDKKIINLLFQVNPEANFGMQSPLRINDVILSDTLGNNVTGQTQILDGSFLVMGCREDFNGNGQVDIVDLVTLAKAYGQKNGEMQYRDYLDLNMDHCIDIYDLVILSKNYGRESE